MNSEQSYSVLDRLIHRLAFATRGIQLTAADIEIALYGKAFRGVQVERPIFITSLPRAGTTLLLEMLIIVYLGLLYLWEILILLVLLIDIFLILERLKFLSYVNT